MAGEGVAEAAKAMGPEASTAPTNGAHAGPIYGPRTVQLGKLSWQLRDGVGLEQLLQWQENSLDAGQAYQIILAAVDAISTAHGDFENLVARIRKTVEATRLARGEIERLAEIFESLYEPAGIRNSFDTTEKFTELVQQTILNCPRRSQ